METGIYLVLGFGSFESSRSVALMLSSSLAPLSLPSTLPDAFQRNQPCRQAAQQREALRRLPQHCYRQNNNEAWV